MPARGTPISELGLVVLAVLASVIAAWTALAWARIDGADRWFFVAMGGLMLAPCVFELSGRYRRWRAERVARRPARATVVRIVRRR